MENRYSRRVQYYETDKMGIVHHSNYIRIFEEARVDYLHKIGLDFAMVESLGFLSPVLSVSCEYMHSLRFGDEFYAETTLSEFGVVKYRLCYKVYQAGTDTLCATGESVHCFTDLDGRVVSLKRENKELYERFASFRAKGE